MFSRPGNENVSARISLALRALILVFAVLAFCDIAYSQPSNDTASQPFTHQDVMAMQKIYNQFKKESIEHKRMEEKYRTNAPFTDLEDRLVNNDTTLLFRIESDLISETNSGNRGHIALSTIYGERSMAVILSDDFDSPNFQDILRSYGASKGDWLIISGGFQSYLGHIGANGVAYTNGNGRVKNIPIFNVRDIHYYEEEPGD